MPYSFYWKSFMLAPSILIGIELLVPEIDAAFVQVKDAFEYDQSN